MGTGYDLTKKQQIEMINEEIQSVRDEFFRRLSNDFTPETKRGCRDESLSRLQGMKTIVHIVFGRENPTFKAANAAYREISEASI